MSNPNSGDLSVIYKELEDLNKIQNQLFLKQKQLAEYMQTLDNNVFFNSFGMFQKFYQQSHFAQSLQLEGMLSNNNK